MPCHGDPLEFNNTFIPSNATQSQSIQWKVGEGSLGRASAPSVPMGHRWARGSPGRHHEDFRSHRGLEFGPEICARALVPTVLHRFSRRSQKATRKGQESKISGKAKFTVRVSGKYLIRLELGRVVVNAL